jgi:hypothetical protein
MPMNFPDTPTNGQTFTSGGVVWSWNGTSWNPTTTPGGAGVSNVFIADTAPANSVNGNLWWNSSPGDGQLYTYFDDGTSRQWVVANNLGAGIYLPLTGGQLSGPLTPAGIVGITNASNAAAGQVGEFLQASVASSPGVAIVNTTAMNITSISLTAGDWDIDGVCVYATAGGGSLTFATGCVNIQSATLAGETNRQQLAFSGTVTFGTIAAPTVRTNVTSTTIAYLIGFIGLSGGTCVAGGTIRARRVR